MSPVVDDVVPTARSVVAPPDGRRAVVVAAGIAATVAFVVLRLVVALGDLAPTSFDVWWNELMGDAHSVVVVVAWVPAVVGGTVGMAVIGVALVAVFVWRRRPWDAVTLGGSIVVVVALGAPMAAIIARVRPADSLAESVATSFPSGHTAVATAVAVSLGLIFRRWYVWTAGALWVVVMMWSRTYLHAHWSTDVLAGMLEGIAVATLVWCAVDLVRDRRARRRHLSTTTRTSDLAASSPHPDRR